MGYQAVLELVRALPSTDQARLVDLINGELLTKSNDSGLTPKQIKEIRRRVAAHKADPSIAIPWEQVEADVEKQLKELGE